MSPSDSKLVRIKAHCALTRCAENYITKACLLGFRRAF